MAERTFRNPDLELLTLDSHYEIPVNVFLVLAADFLRDLPICLEGAILINARAS